MNLSKRNKAIAAALIAVVLAYLGIENLNGPGGADPNDLDIEWWSHLAEVDVTDYADTRILELGFREDGIVVWRYVDPNENAGED